MINQAELVGHSFPCAGRGHRGCDARASAAGTDAMVRIADRALPGAAGVSLGLDTPGRRPTEIDGRHSGRIRARLPVHTRLFTQNDLYSLYEMLAAAKRSGGRLLKAISSTSTAAGTLRQLDVGTPPARGMDVWMDSGIYRLGHLCRHRHL
ncbi:MAG: hypothetical protein ACLR7U_12860 [Ruthenibacterium lactatiformans]